MTHTLRITIFFCFLGMTTVTAQDISYLEGDIKPKDAPTSLTTPNETKYISLRIAIEEGLRNNLSEQIRTFEKEEVQLSWDMAHDKYWMPELNLKLQTDPHLIDKFYTNNEVGVGSPKTPDGVLSFGFENYALFNWGKDYLDYLNAQNTFYRESQAIKEKKRNLRFSVIAQYFKFVWANRMVDIKKRQLRHTSFIYRLSKEKRSARKIGSQEFLQTKAEYLRSHSEYHESLVEKSEVQQTLADMIGDDVDTNYRADQQLQFKTLSILKSESLKLGMQSNPNLLQSKYEMENSQRSFDKRSKENMALPTLNVNLGAYQKAFSTSGSNDGYYSDFDNKNIELTASINATWTIFGQNGFLNSRQVKKVYLDKRKAEVTFYDAKRKIKVDVRSYHQQITYLAKKYEAHEAQFKNAQNAFDKALDNYIASKTAFINIKHLLDEFVTSFAMMETTKYEHLLYKLKLAETIGVDDFPGESFESLVVK